MTDPIRAALERLLARLDETTDPNGPVPAWSDSYLAARAALLADGPAVPEGREPAAVVGEPSDEELRDIWETGHLPSSEELANDDGEQDLQFLFTSAYYRWLEENPDAREEHENKCIRAVFNAGRRWGQQPEPPAEGEVKELVQELRNVVTAYKSCHNQDNIWSLLGGEVNARLTVTLLTRAADLLKHGQSALHRLHRLQQENARFCEPERTILCDLLANGTLLPDPDGKRYGVQPAEGEVAELVAWLREEVADAQGEDCPIVAAKFTRAADLLERQAGPVPVPVPVAVSERPWEREGWCDELGRCWLRGKVEGDWRLLHPTNSGVPQLKYCFSHSLPAHALPTPSPERQ